MNKRGQFYIFTAIIIGLAIFSIISQSNKLEERVLLENFNELSKNYADEAPKVVNEALKENPDSSMVAGELGSFTNNFIDYANTIDPQLGIVYVYKNPDGTATVENVGTTGTITVQGNTDVEDKTLFSGSTETINDINLDLGGQKYTKSVPTKMKYFQGANSGEILNGVKNIEIGGVLYPIKQDKTLTIISTSSSGTEIRKVDIKAR